MITGFIFSIYAYKNNYSSVINFKNNEIIIDDYVGDIKIIKREQNIIKYSNNVEVETISDKVNISSIKKHNLDAIKIIYKDEIFIDISDSIGKITSDLENNSKINIDDFIGDIKIKTSSNVSLQRDDIIGSVSMKNINKESDKTINIYISNLLGKIKISGR
ncbi:hypothetical protein [Oceanivirga salmonicida]|uniref:hypothetical protein n=1 Tax=Oceanivirga salmonicida TaxID=1769291 RepID=UPI0008374BEA|nr:hypothetical protein [Oceanivirga salmonicida]